MEDALKEITVLALWVGTLIWFVRPRRAKGIPIGPYGRCYYLSGRQALFLGAFLIGGGALGLVVGLSARAHRHFLYLAFMLLAMGIVYFYHGRKLKATQENGAQRKYETRT